MAALDTFEWFVSKQPNDEGEIAAFIRKEREYLFSLRSEDERQREVDRIMATLNELVRTTQGGRKRP